MKRLLILLVAVLSIATVSAQTSNSKRKVNETSHQNVNVQHKQRLQVPSSASSSRKVQRPSNSMSSASYFEQCLKKAEKGDVESQAEVGSMFMTNENVTHDYKKAVYWLTKAAKRGNPDAQAELGLCYARGQGVQQNGETALYWLKSATAQNVHFNVELGIIYLLGQGVPADYVKAAECLSEAANAGYCMAQYIAGFCIYHGYGFKQDQVMAQNIFNEVNDYFTDFGTGLIPYNKVEAFARFLKDYPYSLH